jgi:K+-sensing histidine kinase KdpD
MGERGAARRHAALAGACALTLTAMLRHRLPVRLSAEPPPAWLGLLATLAAVAAGTLLVYLLKAAAPVVSLGVVYLPAVLVISIVWGLRLGLLASVLSALAFNFFHLPPLHRFTLAEEGDWVALAAFVLAAAISSAVAELARARAVEAERRREDADRALAELAALSRERDRMQAEMVEAEALRRSDELKTALLRSISHDLRTPLTSIIAGGAALGSATLSSEERTELSAAIVAGGARLSRLVENLLDMSRLEAGKAEPHRERIDLAEVLDAAREAVERPEAVHLAVASDLPAVDADAAQLERAFANLLENGLRHGGGRPVAVNSRLVGERIVVRVVDQGAGIPPGEQQRIFEPFHRGEADGGGSGLGLAIAKGFVEANGGEIAVESLPGQGTSFVVSLPRDPGSHP